MPASFSGLGVNLSNLCRLSSARTRSISPENFTGEKGKGGMANEGTGASCARGLGQGWSWDYLEAGYAAPSSALEFNENIATLTVRPGAKAGDAAQLELPPSTGLGLLHGVVTGEGGTATTISLERPARSPRSARSRSRTPRFISLTH